MSIPLLSVSDIILNLFSLLFLICFNLINTAILNSVSQRSHVSVSPGFVPDALFSSFNESMFSWMELMLVDVLQCVDIEESGIYVVFTGRLSRYLKGLGC